MRAQVVAAITVAKDARNVRQAIVAILRETQDTGRQTIIDAFVADPFNARPTTRAFSWLTDQIVKEALYVATNHLHPVSNPTSGELLSLIAVGGYGRGEMAPQSDVDLLFLTPYKITPWAESVIESMLYILWDLKLKVGHASRTVKDCIRLAREDFTIRTSLVEYRHIAGDAALAVKLGDRLWTDLFQSTALEFIDAKLAERAERHRKQGGQRYMVEPNVKEGKGGLRDLQSLYWIGKYVNGVKNASELVDHKVFTQDEYETFRKAEDFLWAVRCHLHLLTNRPMDQLTFDLQVDVAARMGFDGRWRTPCGRTFHASLFPARHASRRADPHLFDRPRGRAHETRPHVGTVFQAPQEGQTSLCDFAKPDHSRRRRCVFRRSAKSFTYI